MSIYREQQDYQLELSMNGERVLLDWSEDHSIDDEPRLLVRVEQWIEDDPIGFEARLTLDHVKVMHSYLGGLVLPKVEREPKGSPRAHMPWWTADGLRVHAVVGAHGGRGIEVEDHDDLTPTQARALAACLLAAADEAEGVGNA